ncbi:DNA-binding protein [uncultured Propionibacterium sp.]|uniref:DNA-binding protein n=1 Tax=uncultured Propionibacterium sp. TaxID=218066 RepID=UPI002930B39C|nr:DNA-binding protein [uncultured Propionibacterium sp.]
MVSPEEVRARQAVLYGAPLSEVLGRCGSVLGVNQAGLARLLGISAPMLSQLINARRIKIANPAAAARLTRMVSLASDVREGRLPVAAAISQMEADGAAEAPVTTLTAHLPRTIASQVQELFRATAAASDYLRAAELIRPYSPEIAELLRVFGAERLDRAETFVRARGFG